MAVGVYKSGANNAAYLFTVPARGGLLVIGNCDDFTGDHQQ
jgi:hypothetical protein